MDRRKLNSNLTEKLLVGAIMIGLLSGIVKSQDAEKGSEIDDVTVSVEIDADDSVTFPIDI